ncbi:MAG: sugar O-acetyltransferase [Sodaliphilus sp.]|nr:sugar O-acetyltransferase [Sodaliphilus sp.]
MKEIEKLRNGERYSMFDGEISEIQTRAIALCQQYNALPITAAKERDTLLRQLFGSAGKDLSIKPGFQCDMGINIHVGDGFLTNYNVTILDMATVTIGNNVWLGPNVGIYAVAHPMEAAGRVQKLGIAKPITIGDNVWIGGNSVVLMGVTIGNNVVIGAGSVVTKDIPDNAVVVGNPARVIKYIDNSAI